MGWNLGDIESDVEKMSLKERIDYFEAQHAGDEIKNEIIEEIIKTLFSIQKDMSILYNGYESIKKGAKPSLVKSMLTDQGVKVDDMPNPAIKNIIDYFINKFKGGFMEIKKWTEILVPLSQSLGRSIEWTGVSVSASIPPSFSLNFDFGN